MSRTPKISQWGQSQSVGSEPHTTRSVRCVALTLQTYAQSHSEGLLISALPFLIIVLFYTYVVRVRMQAVRKIAETARTRFEGMPGLRSKAFTVNSGKHEATNFYVWDSEDAAKAFFTDALLERVTGLYGVRPSVEFVQIATLVENNPA